MAQALAWGRWVVSETNWSPPEPILWLAAGIAVILLLYSAALWVSWAFSFFGGKRLDRSKRTAIPPTLGGPTTQPTQPRVAAVERDTRLRDAMVFAACRHWRTDVPDDAFAPMGNALHDFHQRAHDGKIQVWGRVGANHGVYTPIPKDYWAAHHVEYLDDLLRSEPKTKPTGHGGAAIPAYFDLQVSRVEVEREWPITRRHPNDAR